LAPLRQDGIAVSFEGRYGQLEIGGKYVGAEFHHSRPLPSRISFYAPVANSIDLSTDYWHRDASKPSTLTVSVDGKVDTVGPEPFIYRWTPFSADFEQTRSVYRVAISYRFCEDLPAMVLQIKVTNLLRQKREFKISTSLETSLRTCQSYTLKDTARVETLYSGAVVVTHFDEQDTDSASVFVVNVGETPVAGLLEKGSEGTRGMLQKRPRASFEYRKVLEPGRDMVIIQVIGSCHQGDSRVVVAQALKSWRRSVERNEQRIRQYVASRARFALRDSSLIQTARWAEAVLAANLHYLDGHIVPMPCPAEYNFYFTHDVLLTDLGAVLFDTDWVKQDLLFLRGLARADSVLPHAYYWRDDGFKTEFCSSDNWNHLWFIILASSYLKHTSDTTTVALLYPMIRKSLNVMLQNRQADDLMYASRPDWWDIGHVYGARAYITVLMIRALREYCYIGLKLGVTDSLGEYIELAQRMERALSAKLWDAGAGYLLNGIGAGAIDRHYYVGSLLAAVFSCLDKQKKRTLLETAQRELLDEKLGIRNVMPADFHQLIDLYKFKGNEAGEPYQYANGGVWPHGIAWYALGLLAADQPDAARHIIKKYLTLEGLRSSPNGQPSFFEYRYADPRSPRYGEIDKPTFLWAAGWYLYALYHLSGVRENEWNLSFDPHLPSGLDAVEYDLMIDGALARVSWTGNGKYFRKIVVDGQKGHSAIFSSAGKRVVLQRGAPDSPYLATASCVVNHVDYQAPKRALQVDVQGVPGQAIELTLIAPFPPKKVLVDDVDRTDALSMERDGSVFSLTFPWMLGGRSAAIVFKF